MLISQNLLNLIQYSFIPLFFSLLFIYPSNPSVLTRIKFYPFFILLIIGIINYFQITILFLFIGITHEFYNIKTTNLTLKIFVYVQSIIVPIYIIYYHSFSNTEIEYTIITCAATDTFGYVIGKVANKYKIFDYKIPVICYISPKKTYGGFIGGSLVAYLFLVYIGNYSKSAVFIIIPLSVIGDLYFSFIKRQLKIKDYGNVFKAHGGIIDRLDSHIFSLFILSLSGWLEFNKIIY